MRSPPSREYECTPCNFWWIGADTNWIFNFWFWYVHDRCRWVVCAELARHLARAWRPRASEGRPRVRRRRKMRKVIANLLPSSSVLAWSTQLISVVVVLSSSVIILFAGLQFSLWPLTSLLTSLTSLMSFSRLAVALLVTCFFFFFWFYWNSLLLLS